MSGGGGGYGPSSRLLGVLCGVSRGYGRSCSGSGTALVVGVVRRRPCVDLQVPHVRGQSLDIGARGTSTLQQYIYSIACTLQQYIYSTATTIHQCIGSSPI